jgi:hypothetical protein
MKKLLLILPLMVIITGCQKDSCINIICLNGGHCTKGACVCPAGYAGEDCGIEKSPKRVKATEVYTVYFPPRDENGNFWNVSGEPLVQLIIIRNILEFIFLSEHQPANPYLESRLYFNKDSDVLIIDKPSRGHYFSLFNFSTNSTSSNLIGEGYFSFWIKGKGFPEYIYAISNDGKTKIKFKVSYEW